MTKIALSVVKGHILIKILVTCLHLQRTKNDYKRVIAIWVLSAVLGHTLKSVIGLLSVLQANFKTSFCGLSDEHQY